MWWADLKAAVGQGITVEGIVSSVSVVVRDRHLVLPHVSVKDLRYIDWEELKRKCFKGVVFEKDNTLTAPYSLAVRPSGLRLSGVRPRLAMKSPCLAILLVKFESFLFVLVVVFASLKMLTFFINFRVWCNLGLTEYDHDDSKANALEAETGIRVLRHRVKKPAGTAKEVEKHFGCASSELIMMGDRPFTDIVYGNRNGFLTILTEPLSRAEEPFIVRQVRRLELALLKRWLRKGLKPVDHSFASDVAKFVKDPSDL